MRSDRHDALQHAAFQYKIDRMLAGDISTPDEESLRVHLHGCARCQEYLSLNTRAIAGLGGFSFAVDPALQARVLESIELRARSLQGTSPSRFHLAQICVLALVLSTSGSFLDVQLGQWAASLLKIQSTHVLHPLLIFWIVPSLCLVLVFALLPQLLPQVSMQLFRNEERPI